MDIDKNMEVLVVDDFATMRRVIKNLLKQVEYKNITEAEDGVAALSVLKSQNINFIISDWNMPNMNGLDFLKAVRADSKLSGLPFLMVTAEALKENIVLAIKEGVSGYIVKPFTADVLNKKIEEIVNSL